MLVYLVIAKMHWHNEYQPIINGQTSVHYNVLPINHQNTNIIVLTYYLITKPSIELVHPPFTYQNHHVKLL